MITPSVHDLTALCPNKEMVMITSCNCFNEFQDKTYGYGRRVFNVCKTGLRCTVCGTVKKDVPKVEVKADEKNEVKK
jgi:hypothetical protein